MKKILFLVIFGLFLDLNALEIETNGHREGTISPVNSIDSARRQSANPDLLNAVKKGDVNTVKVEIDKFGADPSFKDTFDKNQKYKPVLSIAIEMGIINDKYNYADVAKFLIERGADVNATDADGYTPLDYLFKTGLMGARNLIREKTHKEFDKKTHKEFDNRLRQLLISKGAKHSDKYQKEDKLKRHLLS